ncbi:MAG TPA: hypothetical protein DCW76_02040 [Lysinibacillus sp.]|nr:hypothetical protein [Lysinibacillus sp.]
MKLETYNHIKENIHRLEIDYENGKILNKTVHLSGNGYYHICLKCKKITVHSIIAFLTFGEKTIGLMVNHLNGIKTDNRPSNLEMTTNSGNLKHAYKLGLSKAPRVYGVNHGKSKLTNKKVLEIRSLLESGEKQREIAKKYGISQSAVNQINQRRTWANI